MTHTHTHTLNMYTCTINMQQPNPVTEETWIDIKRRNGVGTLNVQPWEEGTSCILSGCYDNSQERDRPTRGIPDATCTVHTTHAGEEMI